VWGVLGDEKELRECGVEVNKVDDLHEYHLPLVLVEILGDCLWFLRAWILLVQNACVIHYVLRDPPYPINAYTMAPIK
jgi:hypothetical protein